MRQHVFNKSVKLMQILPPQADMCTVCQNSYMELVLALFHLVLLKEDIGLEHLHVKKRFLLLIMKNSFVIKSDIISMKLKMLVLQLKNK